MGRWTALVLNIIASTTSWSVKWEGGREVVQDMRGTCPLGRIESCM